MAAAGAAGPSPAPGSSGSRPAREVGAAPTPVSQTRGTNREASGFRPRSQTGGAGLEPGPARVCAATVHCRGELTTDPRRRGGPGPAAARVTDSSGPARRPERAAGAAPQVGAGRCSPFQGRGTRNLRKPAAQVTHIPQSQVRSAGEDPEDPTRSLGRRGSASGAGGRAPPAHGTNRGGGRGAPPHNAGRGGRPGTRPGAGAGGCGPGPGRRGRGGGTGGDGTGGAGRRAGAARSQLTSAMLAARPGTLRHKGRRRGAGPDRKSVV